MYENDARWFKFSQNTLGTWEVPMHMVFSTCFHGGSLLVWLVKSNLGFILVIEFPPCSHTPSHLVPQSTQTLNVLLTLPFKPLNTFMFCNAAYIHQLFLVPQNKLTNCGEVKLCLFYEKIKGFFLVCYVIIKY